MGVLDRTASAFLTVVHALSVLRPGGKSRDGEHKLNVTVHEGKVGRQSQSKYLVTLRVGKEKKETKKRRSDGLLWDYGAEFLHWTPADPLILKLRKAKRCKDNTVAVLSLDVAAAIESVDGLPNRWWYALDRIDKSGRQKEEAFLQVTVTVDGLEGKHGSTQDQDRAKPVQKTVQPAAPENPETTSPPSAGRDAVAAPSSTTSSAPSQSAKPSAKGKVKLRRECRQSSSQNGEATSSKSSHSASTVGTPGRSSTKGEVRPRRSSGSQEGEAGTSESSCRTDTSPPSAAGDVADDKPESSPTTVLTPSPPAPSYTPDQAATSGSGEGDVKPGPEGHSSRDKDVEVSPVSIDVDSSTGYMDSGRGEDTAKSGFPEKTVPLEKPETSAELKEIIEELEVPQVATTVDKDSGQGQGPTSSPPASPNTPDQAATSGSGEGDVMAGPEGHSSRDKDVEVSPVSIDVDSSTGYIDFGRGQYPTEPGSSDKTVPLEEPETPNSAKLTEMIEGAELEFPQVDTTVDNDSGQGQAPAETEPPKDTESPDNGTSDAESDRPDTASSPQGGEVALPLTDPPPRHKDADEPTYESLVWSIEDKWEDIMSKKQYADELYTYANTLRSKLEATVPHVLNYTVIKNLAAKVPKCPDYELPDTQGMSLEDLQHIRDTLTKLSLKEEERATYLRRWYIEDLCAVAMREAPQVLETLKYM
ncbi:PREDICTED: mucin-5AC-like [Branchiostoma belcheri]|uniref:Mucin-5AC-like n=1 Tax=Branchiostoma belcheri TaxID=7741 RepID=A0A6P4YS05_BRABE|nr:PREDICTED: mucin-5AC-like [Branchiostoma belcheri]